jgi:hypothetical protein
MTTNTDYSKQIDILHEVFYNHLGEEKFEEFASFNDIGLPLAHAIYAGIVESTPMAEELVRQTFTLLLALFDIDQDEGFDSLDQIINAA